MTMNRKYLVTVYKNGKQYESHKYDDYDKARAAAERLESKYADSGMEVELRQVSKK